MWAPTFDQYQYEGRLQTEAEVMIALETMRFALISLEEDLETTENCVQVNDQGL